MSRSATATPSDAAEAADRYGSATVTTPPSARTRSTYARPVRDAPTTPAGLPPSSCRSGADAFASGHGTTGYKQDRRTATWTRRP